VLTTELCPLQFFLLTDNWMLGEWLRCSWKNEVSGDRARRPSPAPQPIEIAAPRISAACRSSEPASIAGKAELREKQQAAIGTNYTTNDDSQNNMGCWAKT